MRSYLQIGLLLAILVGGVFVLTFLTQNTRSPVDAPRVASNKSETTGGGEPLDIPEKTAVWDKDDPSYMAEFEVGDRGHYDFWVANRHAEPVNVALMTNSCVCTEVQVGIVPPQQSTAWIQRTRDLAPIGAALDLIGAPNLVGPLTYNGFNGQVD